MTPRTENIIGAVIIGTVPLVLLGLALVIAPHYVAYYKETVNNAKTQSIVYDSVAYIRCDSARLEGKAIMSCEQIRKPSCEGEE